MLTVAEWVLPGHPDKLCDQIADRIVDAACALDLRALVGVEVAIHRSTIFVDGRIGCPGAETIDVDGISRSVLREVGYRAEVIPDPATLRVMTELCQNDFAPGEREFRSFSDDQNIVTGYAEDRPETNFLPLTPVVARTLGLALEELCRREPSLGPDGKVIVWLDETESTPRLTSVSVSIHHRPDVGLIEIKELVKDAFEPTLAGFEGIETAWSGGQTDIFTNGAGDFAVGGPEGDNGLSGKKLVVDAYGPHIPIGGGALSGKDPHKVDRIFALRARQIAKHLVIAGLAERALVHLATLPGDQAPRWITVQFGRRDGQNLLWQPAPSALAKRWLAGYDLSIDGSFRDLGLEQVRWAPLAIHGHFHDPTWPWEQWQPGHP